MLKLFIVLLSSFPQDSILKDSSVSIMFKKAPLNADVDRIKYRHQQGFFCDFEDKINKERKMNLNIGVGDQ